MNKIISILLVLVLVSGFALADEPVKEPVVKEMPIEEILGEELPIDEENHTHNEIGSVEHISQEEDSGDYLCDVNGDGNEDLSDAIYLAELTRIDLDGDGAVDFHDAALLNEAIEQGSCSQFWSFLNTEPVVEESSSNSGGSVVTCLDGYHMVNRVCILDEVLTEETAEEQNSLLVEEVSSETNVFDTITGAVVGTGKSFGFGQTMSFVASLLIATLGMVGSLKLLENSK